MQTAPKPENEISRLAKLHSYHILDTLDEKAYDDITKIAANICGTPTALISLLDGERQWFKSRVGLDTKETDRSLAFCAHAINQNDVFCIPDARIDERFHDNPLVTGAPHVTFYAGAPITTADGYKLGTVCVIDKVPRELSKKQEGLLIGLARQVSIILELRLAKFELTKTNLELDQFVHVVSHDLKAPLRHITMFSKMLKENLGPNQDQEGKTILDGITNGTLRMNTIVNDMLNLSKLKKIEESEMRVTSLDLILTEIKKELHEDLESSNADLSWNNAPSVICKPSYIRHLLQSLIANALKFKKTDVPPKIKILFDKNDNEWVITVADNGIGIDSKYHTKIFKIFERLHNQSTYKGTGIGLAICKKIVDLHGGIISVDSKPDIGSNFHFTLKK